MASSSGAMQQPTNLEMRTHSSILASQVPDPPQTEDREMADETPVPTTAEQTQHNQANPIQPQPGAQANVLADQGNAQTTNMLRKGVFESTGNPQDIPRRVKYIYVAHGCYYRYDRNEGEYEKEHTVYGAFANKNAAENRIRKQTHRGIEYESIDGSAVWEEYNRDGCLMLVLDPGDGKSDTAELWVEQIELEASSGEEMVEVVDR
jgi:hypothetical protein